MTDEDVFEPHSSLANLDFVKGHIENSEKTKLDWIGLFAFFFFFYFFCRVLIENLSFNVVSATLKNQV